MATTLALPVVPSIGSAARWTGRTLSVLAVAFFLFDASLKLAGHPAVTEA